MRWEAKPPTPQIHRVWVLFPRQTVDGFVVMMEHVWRRLPGGWPDEGSTYYCKHPHTGEWAS